MNIVKATLIVCATLATLLVLGFVLIIGAGVAATKGVASARAATIATQQKKIQDDKVKEAALPLRVLDKAHPIAVETHGRRNIAILDQGTSVRVLDTFPNGVIEVRVIDGNYSGQRGMINEAP